MSNRKGENAAMLPNSIIYKIKGYPKTKGYEISDKNVSSKLNKFILSLILHTIKLK